MWIPFRFSDIFHNLYIISLFYTKLKSFSAAAVTLCKTKNSLLNLLKYMQNPPQKLHFSICFSLFFPVNSSFFDCSFVQSLYSFFVKKETGISSICAFPHNINRRNAFSLSFLEKFNLFLLFCTYMKNFLQKFFFCTNHKRIQLQPGRILLQKAQQ